jgi:protein TonB
MKRLLPLLSLFVLAGCATPPASTSLAPAFRPDVLYFANNDAGKKGAEEVKGLFGGRQEVQLVEKEPRVSGFPQPVSQSLPLYPAAMRGRNLEGQVVVEFIVREDGKVVEAAAVGTSNPGFNEEAVAAVKRWVFKPATREGVPVRTLLRVPVIFSLPK